MSDATVQKGSEPVDVAREIYRAAVDPGGRLRYPVGTDAKQARFMRWLLPERLFYWMIEKVTLEPPSKN